MRFHLFKANIFLDSGWSSVGYAPGYGNSIDFGGIPSVGSRNLGYGGWPVSTRGWSGPSYNGGWQGAPSYSQGWQGTPISSGWAETPSYNAWPTNNEWSKGPVYGRWSGASPSYGKGWSSYGTRTNKWK